VVKIGDSEFSPQNFLDTVEQLIVRDRMTAPDELQVADLIARGLLASPTKFRGSTFIKLRVSGCGIAWRPAVKEWCLRPADVWLSSRMMRRCAGIPVIIKHPPSGVIDGEELRERAIGVCLLGYIKDGELWTVARIVDQEAAEALSVGTYDTSPAVQFTGKQKFVQVGKSKLLIEDDVALLDHLAICQTGVWTRTGEPGVDVGEQRNAAN
jgi:hypothetical protein